MFSDEDSDPFDRGDENTPKSVRKLSSSPSDLCIPLSPILSREALDVSISRGRLQQENRLDNLTTQNKDEPVFVNQSKSPTVLKTPAKASDLLFSDEESFDIVSHYEENNTDRKLSPVPNLFVDSPQYGDVMEEDNESERAQSPSIAHITTSYMDALKEMEDLDEMARQLKTAVELRKQSEKSSSCRGIDGLFKCDIEAKSLSSGSQLLIIHVSNYSHFDLKDWILTIDWKPSEPNAEDCRCHSQSVDLGHFAMRQKKSFELFVSSDGYKPMLFTIEMHRVFNIDGSLTCFRIPLTSSIYNSLNRLEIPDKIEHLKEKRIMTSIVVPCTLAKLLCGRSESPADLLRFLLRPSLQDKMITTESTMSALFSLSNNQSERVTFSVKKNGEIYNLDIYAKLESRKIIVCDIQLYIILETFLLRMGPKNKMINLSNLVSVTQLYESVISMYK